MALEEIPSEISGPWNFLRDSSDFNEGRKDGKNMPLPKNDGGVVDFYTVQENLSQEFLEGIKQGVKERGRGYSVYNIKQDDEDEFVYHIRVDKEFN